MATWIAKDCGCRQEVYAGQKRDKICELHGNLFESEATIEGRQNRWSPSKRSGEPKRDWSDALAKVDHEHCCRICKKSRAPGRPLEVAHVLGRELNVLPYLTLEEQLQAVRDAGGIEAARIRLEPVSHRQEVEAASALAIQGAVE